jgi:hypothetical protein
LRFRIGPLPGAYYDVYDSSDLTNWAQIGGITLNASGTNVFTDFAVAGITNRFYKVTSGDCCSQAIGFTRYSLAADKQAMLANQFDAPANTLDGLFNPMADGNVLSDGTTVQKFNGSSYDNYTWNAGSWSPNGNATLNPGESVWVINNTNTTLGVVFAGLVREGSLTNLLQVGTNLCSAQIPRGGKLQTGLGYPPTLGDLVYRWNGTAYVSYGYVVSGKGTSATTNWTPSEPYLGLGEGVLIKTTNSRPWIMNYSPCQ